MSRYIEADHLKKSVEGLQDCYNGFSDTYDKACIIGLIDEEPTVDVVQVVRCSDCRFSSNDAEYCDYHRTPTTENRFCSDGRKRA
jgi:hypothetical protein